MSRSDKYYVSMIDRFLSGWGEADGKRNIYLVECDTEDQATSVFRAALCRNEMCKQLLHRSGKPSWPESTHLVSQVHYDDLGPIWKRSERS